MRLDTKISFTLPPGVEAVVRDGVLTITGLSSAHCEAYALELREVANSLRRIEQPKGYVDTVTG